MITHVKSTTVFVSDQDRALDFYVDKLGFEKRVDIPFGNGYRWIEVGLRDEATTVALAPPPEGEPVGKRETGISLQTDDIDAYHRQLQQNGVDVDADILDSLTVLSQVLAKIRSPAFCQETLVTEAQAQDWVQRVERVLQFAEHLLRRLRRAR